MKKRIISAFLAFIMVFAMVVPIFAESTEKDAKTEKVTLHKILQTKESLDKSEFPGTKGLDRTEYDGNNIQNLEGYFGKDAREIAGVFFAVQNEDGKYISKTGQPLEQDLKVTDTKFKNQVLGGLTVEGKGLVLETQNLPQEKPTKYKIVEISELTTYKKEDGYILADSKAVPVEITLPLTNNKGVVTEAHVYPKNTEEKPQIDKNFAKDSNLKNLTDQQIEGGADYNKYGVDKEIAQAELGKVVPYEVKTKINAGTRYQTLNWKDTMSNGLTLDKELLELKATKDSNKAIALTKGEHYKVTADDRGFTLSLTNKGFEEINKITNPVDQRAKGESVEFILTYKATVNRNAIVDIPEKNDIKLEYSNNSKEEQKPTPVKPKDGELRVTKNWTYKTQNEEVQVVYTLTNSEKNISAAVMLNGKEENNKVFDLGNGIKFTVTGDYSGKFIGLCEEAEGWTISERVAGYNGDIKANNENGSVDIENKKDNDNPTPLNPTEAKVVYYGKRFVKADATTGERLQGAEFVVKNEQGRYLALKSGNDQADLTEAKRKYEEAIDAWNKAIQENAGKSDKQIEILIDSQRLTGKDSVQQKITELRTTYDQVFRKVANAYEWVANKEGNNVVKLISDSQGKFEITGLESGNYKLEETKSPAGYAVRSEEAFVVGSKTYSSHANGVTYVSNDNVKNNVGNEAQRIDNKKISIPQTGGIGTVIFTVAGLIIMGAAIYALKKNNQEVDA